MTNANAVITSALLGARICEWARRWVGRIDHVWYERLSQDQPCGACGRWMQAGERVIAHLHRAAGAAHYDRWVYMHKACECETDGSRQMCRTDKHGFPKAHRTRKVVFMGFQTGDIVKAEIPNGKFAGRHVGRLSAVRQRPSFTLNGFDAHPKYLRRIHHSDGFNYQTKTAG
jgi:hypothetical protein